MFPKASGVEIASRMEKHKWCYHVFSSRILCLTVPKNSTTGIFWCLWLLACARHRKHLHDLMLQIGMPGEQVGEKVQNNNNVKK